MRRNPSAAALREERLPAQYEERLQYRHWVTPQSLTQAPIHRWFVFPHSYGRELVWELIDEWGLTSQDHILDPFVGAGTTLLAAKERGLSATGVDLSPLAVFVSRTKLNDLSHEYAEQAVKKFVADIQTRPDLPIQPSDAFIQKFFPPLVYRRLKTIKTAILEELEGQLKDFFLLAMLAILKNFSLAVRDGGWLRWQPRGISPDEILPIFAQQLQIMLDDLSKANFPSSRGVQQVFQGDARSLDLSEQYTAVITSPPYPNRHDYSRIFNVELAFAFLQDNEILQLRYKSFRSHVEARPLDNTNDLSILPPSLFDLVTTLREKKSDRRVPAMLLGYFQDMYQVLATLRNILANGARLAFVVGNVRYKGEMVEVDELLAELAQKAGFTWLKTWIVRYRGNSAQQMGRYGRERSRESVVLLQKI